MPLSEAAQRLGMRTFDEMVDTALKVIVGSNVGVTNTSPGSVTRTLVEALIQNDASSNYYIERVYNAMNLDTARGIDLDNLVAILGIVRERATYARGIITMTTGKEPAKFDIPIPWHTLITTRKDNSGKVLEFITMDEDAVLKAGQSFIDVNVIAVEAGKTYVQSGGLSVLMSAINGIQSVYNADVINSGTDEESDDDLRARAKDVSRSFGKCTETAIEIAVKEVDGVLDCDVVDMPDGQIGVIDVNVSTEIIPPPDDIKAKIREVVMAVKAAGIHPNIAYPTVYQNTGISISVELYRNDGTKYNVSDHNIVIKAITGYMLTLSIGEPFLIKQMEKFILNALNDDEVDIKTLKPTANITPKFMEIIRVADITINGVKYDV